MNQKTYELNGVKYIQRPIVLAQFRALLPILEGIEIREESGAGEIANTLGEKLPKALAIVLIEEGLDVRDALGKLDDRAKQLECRIGLEETLGAIEDFFAFNRVSSVLEKLTGIMRSVTSGIPASLASKVDLSSRSRGSSKSSGDSAAETSPRGRKSSGA
jgi:hypothetical protein